MKSKRGSKGTSQRAFDILVEFTATRGAFSNEAWNHAFDKLNCAFYRDSPHANSPTADHILIQDTLPLYITDEQMGSDIRRIYPLVWQHLQTCSLCLENYEMLANPPPAKVESHGERGPGASANVPPPPELADICR